MLSASDKHSHALARYTLSAAIGTFSSSDFLLLRLATLATGSFALVPDRSGRHPIGAQAPPAVPGAGTNPRRRMSSVSPSAKLSGNRIARSSSTIVRTATGPPKGHPGAMFRMRLKANLFRAAAEVSAERTCCIQRGLPEVAAAQEPKAGRVQ